MKFRSYLMLSLQKLNLRPCWAVLLGAPRVLVSLGAVGASLTLFSGCVSTLRYEEATSAAEVASEASRRSALELEAAKARIAALEADLKARSAGLEDRDQKIAEEKFERSVVTKQREETSSLVDQLRGELARANEHLASYARNNARLEQALAPVNPPREAGASLRSEVEAAIQAAHLEKSLSVVESAGNVVVSVPADAVFQPADAAIRPNIGALSAAVGSFVAAHPELAFRVREGALDSALPESLGRERRERLRALLANPKWGDRLSFEPAESSSAPKSYDFVLVSRALPEAGQVTR